MDFQAAMTTTVTTAMAASEIRTTFVSIRRLRRWGRTAERRARESLVVACAEARVVFVHVELAVEAEVLGVRAQEALDVGLRREQLEALVLEGAEVLPANLRGKLRLGKVDPTARARLVEAVADLEHGARKGTGLLAQAQNLVHPERDSADQGKIDPRPRQEAADPRQGQAFAADGPRHREAGPARPVRPRSARAPQRPARSRRASLTRPIEADRCATSIPAGIAATAARPNTRAAPAGTLGLTAQTPGGRSGASGDGTSGPSARRRRARRRVAGRRRAPAPPRLVGTSGSRRTIPTAPARIP